MKGATQRGGLRRVPAAEGAGVRVVIQYRLREDKKDLDRRLVAAVHEELDRVRPDWLLRWDVYRLEDDVTTVSVVDVDDPSQLRRLVEFTAYTETLDARCEEPPTTSLVEQLGSYRP
jgi:hypothetical protein